MPKPDLPVYPNLMPRLISSNGLQVREDVLFTDAGGEQSDRKQKSAQKLLEKWRDTLPGLLVQGEAVLHIAGICRAPMSLFEQWLLGWHVYTTGGTTLVLTNLRLIHLGVNTRGKWTRVLKSVYWGDVAEAKIKGLITKELRLKYADGKKEKYWSIPARDGKKIARILTVVLPASQGEKTGAAGMVSLCPDCRAILNPGNYRCPQCGLAFKDEKTLIRRVMLIPGGGFFYAQMTFLALLSLFVQGVFLFVLLMYVAMAVGAIPLERGEDGRIIGSTELWSLVAIFAGFVVFHKLLEYYHTRRVIRNFLPANDRKA